MSGQVHDITEGTAAGDVVRQLSEAVKAGARELYAVVMSSDGVECYFTPPEDIFRAMGAAAYLSRHLSDQLDTEE